jgi:L-fuculokinase
MPKPVIAIFDVGKTNKKIFLIDEQYNIVFEQTAKFIETIDEDGDPCENLDSLRISIFESLHFVQQLAEFEIKAINFSSYGASFVYVDDCGVALTPLYNYLKPYPKSLQDQFYSNYGGEELLAKQTASPVLGSLNSGLQFYRLKHENKAIFDKVKYALHLPQYLSYLLTGQAYTDITSVGCHTHLWNFNENKYHDWVSAEGLIQKFGELKSGDYATDIDLEGANYKVGIGLHDSSAALIPYLANFDMPFILLSTGTWCISLNPFNNSCLTADELHKECLCYMHYQAKPIKASRLFFGHEHDEQVERIANHFKLSSHIFKQIKFADVELNILQHKFPENNSAVTEFSEYSAFSNRDISLFDTPEQAYHQLIVDLVRQQVYSIKLIMSENIKRIFVDGGFSKNDIYMHLLSSALPNIEVYASSVSQATAIGTALAIHHAWNKNPIPNNIIQLKYYSSKGVNSGKSV